jgi:predicted nucleic acid-binding protein
MELIADTTFLIGLWRKQSWAVSFAKSNSHRSLILPWVVLGEFWHGALMAGHDPEIVERFLAKGLPSNDACAVVPAYARICKQLQESGFYKNIGQNDLWIAAVGITRDAPLVTRNCRHFEKIAGLKLEVLVPD